MKSQLKEKTFFLLEYPEFSSKPTYPSFHPEPKQQFVEKLFVFHSKKKEKNNQPNKKLSKKNIVQPSAIFTVFSM
jgi:hypothetical protein